MNSYIPMFFSWCKSYEEEVKLMRILIMRAPADLKQLKQEYMQLTGKRFRISNKEKRS